MKSTDPVPLQDQKQTDELTKRPVEQERKREKESNKSDKKKKKRNLWPLKAMIITLFLAFAVNAGSELLLGDELWLAILLTCIILAVGVVFDMIGTASTACDVEPFLSMASRKVKGAKTAVKLSKSSHIVSSVCCDIVGDICGIVSGVCAATIVVFLTEGLTASLSPTANFFVKVAIYAVISTATITLKAAGKNFAVSKSNNIIFGVAKFLSIFHKEG